VALFLVFLVLLVELFSTVEVIEPSLSTGGASFGSTSVSLASDIGDSLQVRGTLLGQLLGREKLMMCPSPIRGRRLVDCMNSLAFSKWPRDIRRAVKKPAHSTGTVN